MEANVKVIISEDLAQLPTALAQLLEQNAKTYTFPELNSANYRKDLWKALTNILYNENARNVHYDCLAAIRILSRDKTELRHLASEKLLTILQQKAGLKEEIKFDDEYNRTVSEESLKCLCNLVYNSPSVAKSCAQNGTVDEIIRRLRTYKENKIPSQIQYFDMRLLFIITAIVSEIRGRLKDELHGLTYLIEKLSAILSENEGEEHDELSDSKIDLACQILMVLFNLTVHTNSQIDEEEEAHLMRLVSILHEYLVLPVKDQQKRNDLTNHIVNLLTNMPANSFKNLFTPVLEQDVPKNLQFEEHNMRGIHEILEFLRNKFTAETTVSNQHELLSPVLSALLNAAVNERVIRKYLRIQILPPLRDVRTRPEQGKTLRNHLCKLLTTPITQVRHLAAELLFVLCKENATRMIKYTGYGNAAGLFATHGLLSGKNGDVSNYSSDSGDSDTEEYKELKHGINPVMGCYEAPHANPMAGMSEEQKEHEAMKLVELMDSLAKAGVVTPCKIGEDGRPEPVEHILQLQEGLSGQQIHMRRPPNLDDDDSD